MIAVDTNFLIDVLRGSSTAVAKLNELLVGPRPHTTQINAFELYKGLYHLTSSERANRQAKVDKILNSFTVLDLDSQASRTAARVWGLLKQAGQPIDAADVLIAGTLLAHGCNVIVSNDAHFDRIEGLAVENY